MTSRHNTLSFLLLALTVAELCRAAGSNAVIGVILDHASIAGKELLTSMEIAVEDFANPGNKSLLLLTRDSHGNPLLVASAVLGLVEQPEVRAIVVDSISPQEASSIADISHRANLVPLISVTGSSSASRAGRSQLLQMAADGSICLASVVKSYHWRSVVVLYEEEAYRDVSGLISSLSSSIKAIGSEVEQFLPLPCFSSLQDPKPLIRQKLEKLKEGESKVLVLGWVWVVGEQVGGYLDSIDPFIISSSMQGVIGIKPHVREETEEYKSFSTRFQKRFKLAFPDEQRWAGPGMHALRAYDAMKVMIFAMEKANNSSTKLFDEMLSTNLTGLSGAIEFEDGGKLKRSRASFQIVNVVGRSYREIGSWSEESGFCRSGPIYLPSRSPTVMTERRSLRIAVPAAGVFNLFVKVTQDDTMNRTMVTGFSVDVFAVVVKHLSYPLSYELFPFYGSYDDLVGEVSKKVYDAAVGDIQIMSSRYHSISYSQPYLDSGLVMVVKQRREEDKGWIFIRPFTGSMWLLIAVMCLYTWAVVYAIEGGFVGRAAGEEQSAFPLDSLLWSSLSSFFYQYREPKSNLSRIVLATWLIVVLILNSAFTSTLTSMLTVSQLRPSIDDIDSLKNSGASVGCNGNSFIVAYVIDVLGFHPSKVVPISSVAEYRNAFSSGRIAAAFFVEPHAKAFLTLHCRGFAISGEAYKLGGFGFVFPKDSPLALDVSTAILRANERGDINRLERSLLASSKCVGVENDDDHGGGSMDPAAFRMLFFVLGGVASAALFISWVSSTRKDFFCRLILTKQK
ncbi:hypothetical protein HPP92_024036 [Vanilla planifolia]|uniref:Ionotropic glutamate receptor C-terminal domain-containing protein n=1 Tax=Vanilla planifolia TaxID=51239 RepID=A0A835PK54_VANPL|nr:hypothetical protein HPP92_024036 [Vanilla planifolia]